MPRAFYRCGDLFLMMHAKAGFLSWFYFIKAGHKTRQQFCVFKIYEVNIFLAKITKHMIYERSEETARYLVYNLERDILHIDLLGFVVVKSDWL